MNKNPMNFMFVKYTEFPKASHKEIHNNGFIGKLQFQ